MHPFRSLPSPLHVVIEEAPDWTVEYTPLAMLCVYAASRRAYATNLAWAAGDQPVRRWLPSKLPPVHDIALLPPWRPSKHTRCRMLVLIVVSLVQMVVWFAAVPLLVGCHEWAHGLPAASVVGAPVALYGCLLWLHLLDAILLGRGESRKRPEAVALTGPLQVTNFGV
jgi:hypothetical protein